MTTVHEIDCCNFYKHLPHAYYHHVLCTMKKYFLTKTKHPNKAYMQAHIHSVYMCEPLLQYNTCGNSCTVNNLTNLFSSCFCSIHSLSFPPLTVWRSLMNSLCASSLLKLPSDFHRFLMTKQEMNHNKNVVNLYGITILTNSWSGSTSEYIHTHVVYVKILAG